MCIEGPSPAPCSCFAVLAATVTMNMKREPSTHKLHFHIGSGGQRSSRYPIVGVQPITVRSLQLHVRGPLRPVLGRFQCGSQEAVPAVPGKVCESLAPLQHSL